MQPIKALLAVAILTVSACAQPAPDAYFERQVNDLESPDESTRRDALMRLEAYGATANEALVTALGDKSDIISRQAQDWLIRQGHTAVPLLARALVDVPEDSGLFARIAGGRERHRGRSIASALWLTLGRGVDPERRVDELKNLLNHSSPRVRAVAVFTAVTLRSSEFLPILEQAASDTDPLVQTALHRGLVRLLQRGSYSTPVLNADTEAAALDLLAPRIAEAAADVELGFTQGDTTFGAMLGNDPLEHHRLRFRDLLKTALGSEELTVEAQKNLGLALLHQSEEEEINALAAELLAEAGDPQSQPALPPQLVALSMFPDTVFSAESLAPLVGWLEAVHQPHRPAATLAAAAYSRAEALDEAKTSLRARLELESLLNNPASRTDATLATARLLAMGRRQPSTASTTIRQAITPEIDSIWSEVSGASIERSCELVQIFWLLDDPRYFEIFQDLWQHRSTVTLRDEQIFSSCLSFLGWSLRDARLIDMLRPFVENAKTTDHSLVLDTAASVLVGALAGEHQSFWSDEVFASWLAILEDPESHPRLRARMTMMMNSPALSEEQGETVRAAMIRILGTPVDANLRDKILSRLTYRGDKRILPEAYGLLTDRDQVHWALSNVISDLPGTAWKIETDELIEILDGMCKRYGPPDDEIKLVIVSNYFNWAVQYQVYPPRRAADELRRRTRQDFGYDAEAWRQWWAKQEG